MVSDKACEGYVIILFHCLGELQIIEFPDEKDIEKFVAVHYCFPRASATINDQLIGNLDYRLQATSEDDLLDSVPNMISLCFKSTFIMLQSIC
ncbi:hypothetical protein [Sporosarcina sp. FA9]|uniref:hypothetical protein n=1 Tax=Sporosarcina sp. FA9 TaxID=3413030 RepID=UPI003F660C1A